MENQNTPELAQETPSKKLGLFALVGAILVTVIAAGVYFFAQTEATPPELTTKSNTYQGFIEDKELGAVKWEKKDLKAYDDAIKALEKESGKKDKPLKADKNKVNIFFATQDTTLKEIIDLTSRKEKGRVIWAVYQDKFIMTKNTFFNTLDDKKKEIAIMVDPKKADDLEEIEIKENEAVFIMADYAPDIHLLSKETDSPASVMTLDYFTKGWHAIAVKDLETLLEKVDPATYSMWGTKNNKDFKKLKTLAEKKDYNNIVWINVKNDKLVKADKAAAEKALADKAAADADKALADKALADKKAEEDKAAQDAIDAAAKAAKATQDAADAANKTVVALTKPTVTAPAPATDNPQTIEISPDPAADLQLITSYSFSVNLVDKASNPSIIDSTDIAISVDAHSTITPKSGTNWNVSTTAATAKVTVSIPKDLPAGTYIITVQAKGAAGTTASAYTTATVTIPAKPEANIAPVITMTAISGAQDSTKDLKISWKATDTKQTQYTDTRQKKPTLSYTWIFTDITVSDTPDEKWRLGPTWGKEDTQTTVTNAHDGDCFKKVFGADGKEITAIGREWICSDMMLEALRLDTGKTYKFEVTAFDGELSSAPASVTFSTAKTAASLPYHFASRFNVTTATDIFLEEIPTATDYGFASVFNVIDMILNLFK